LMLPCRQYEVPSLEGFSSSSMDRTCTFSGAQSGGVSANSASAATYGTFKYDEPSYGVAAVTYLHL